MVSCGLGSIGPNPCCRSRSLIREGVVLSYSLGRRRRTLALLLVVIACNDDTMTGPAVPIPAAPSELSGAWTFSDSTSAKTAVEEAVCLNRGVMTFTAAMDNTSADLRLVGSCRSPRGPAGITMKMAGPAVTIVGDSVAFAVANTIGPVVESCSYSGRLTGGNTLSAHGTVSCSARGTGTWEMTWGLGRGPVVGKLVSIDIGYGHTCALDTGGQAWCWGSNSYGDLGTGNDVPSLVPTRVAGGVRFSQLAVAREGKVNCGLTASGEAWCWGSSWGGVLGDGAGAVGGQPVTAPQRVVGGLTFRQIAPAGSHVCAITTAGKAYCWGTNSLGQLGTGDDAPSSTPVPVSGGLTFTHISSYTLNTCGVTTSGDAYCWGEGWSGVLGNGEEFDSNVPVLVSGGHKFASISVGLWLACAVTTEGDGYCWGSGGYGLGTGTDEGYSTTPVLVTGGMKWKSIRAGSFIACGVTTTNAGYCWGDNFLGTLGAGPGWKDGSNRPVAIAGNYAFNQVVIDYQGCGLTVNGVAYCWGLGENGEIGDGDLRNRFAPAKVAGQQ
jgi:alpha-tubulin suppressor-like RCC1 family protein